MDATNQSFNQSFVFNNGHDVESFNNNDISTESVKGLMRTITKDHGNTEGLYLTDESKSNNQPNHVTERSTATITDDNKEEVCTRGKCEVDKPAEQINQVTKKLHYTIDGDVIPPRTAYRICKAEVTALEDNINEMKKKLNRLNKDSSNKSEAIAKLEANLNKILEELSTVTKAVEYHKIRIYDRKSYGFNCHKVRSTIFKAIPDFEKSCPHSRNIHARLTSFCSKVKATFTTVKGLVTVVKALVNVIEVLLKNVLLPIVKLAVVLLPVIGILACLIVLGNPVILIVVAPLLIVMAALCISGLVSSCMTGGGDVERSEDEESTPILEEINTMAECLRTTDSYPDIDAITQLIIKMSDHSYLSGDSDYDKIHNDVTTYLKGHPTIIHSLIDHSSAQDYQLLGGMIREVNDYEHSISLKQINKYFGLLMTYTSVYKANDYAVSVVKAVSKKVAAGLLWLPCHYDLSLVLINDWYDSPPTFDKLYKNKNGDDCITLTYVDKKSKETIHGSDSVDKLIDFMEHLHISIAIAEKNDTLSKKEQEILKKAKTVYKDTQSKLLEVCPKYKQKLDSFV